MVRYYERHLFHKQTNAHTQLLTHTTLSYILSTIH
jgi:hypothetical protein